MRAQVEARSKPQRMAALLCVAAALGGCTRPPTDATAKPVVAVSVPPQAYFVERLAADLVRVELMLPPGANPHVHEPTFQQVRALAQAAVYVKVGHPKFSFEGAWLDRLLADNPRVRIVNCVAGVESDADDPHVWLSPHLVRAMLPDLAASLVAVLPEQRPVIEKRLAGFLQDIDRLDVEIRAQLAGIKVSRFYVMHAAFAYFARDYGLRQIAFESGSREPGPRQVAALVAQARQEGVRVLFAQPQFSPRHADLIAAEIGARVVLVDPLAHDWTEGLRSFAAALHEALAG